MSESSALSQMILESSLLLCGVEHTHFLTMATLYPFQNQGTLKRSTVHQYDYQEAQAEWSRSWIPPIRSIR